MPRNAHVRPMEHQVTSLPLSPIQADIPITFAENQIQFGSPASTPESWSLSGTTITLEPTGAQSLPVWYQFTFHMASGSTHALEGVGLFSGTNSDSVIFFPASPGGEEVVVNLLDNLGNGTNSVSYQMDFYLLQQGSGTRVVAPDPTITFEPQGNTPPFS